jgi:hypothetical protein
MRERDDRDVAVPSGPVAAIKERIEDQVIGVSPLLL